VIADATRKSRGPHYLLTRQRSDKLADVSVSLSGDRLQAWQKLQTVTEHLRRETGRVLATEAGLSESEFAVLAHLAPTPRGIRSVSCARAMGWDTSRLSHQLRRLERRGYVARSGGDGGDGRATVVALTNEGRRVYRRAVGPHLEAAERWFGQALTDKQVEHLYEVLTAIETHVERHLAASEREDDRQEKRS
jgi:DNA-binding MarR family transcriptional regulator